MTIVNREVSAKAIFANHVNYFQMPVMIDAVPSPDSL
jgi:hypothetical protein